MMIRPLHNFPLLLAVLCLLQLQVVAQQDKKEYRHAFTRQSALEPVSTEGFYRVLLPPQVVGYLHPSFHDLRLYDEQGQEVPYLWRTEKPVSYHTLFREYPLLQNKHKPRCCTELLIHNPERKKIDNFSLLIANADAVKTISLSGSNDRQNWYVVKERDVIHAVRGTAGTNELKLLNFPLSDYEFFRVFIDDSASAPLNIQKAGYYDTYTESGKYTELPQPVITRKDSARTTYLTLRLSQPFYPDRLEFELDQPGYFHRSGQVLIPVEREQQQPKRRKWRKRRQQAEPEPAELVQAFTLRSFVPAVVELPRHQVQELKIEIANADNQPLRIRAVRLYQQNHYLLANLQPDHRYTLRFGSDKPVAAPEYDLHYFADSIPADAPVAHAGAVSAVTMAKAEAKEDSTLLSNIFLWSALLAVAALLGFMTVKLVNDMKKA